MEKHIRYFTTVEIEKKIKWCLQLLHLQLLKTAHQKYSRDKKSWYIREQRQLLYACVLEEQRDLLRLLLLTSLLFLSHHLPLCEWKEMD